MKYRHKAARGLQTDLLHEVPLLYGSPRFHDPDIVTARLHREAMVAKNGGGLPPKVKSTSVARLPFERTVLFLLVLYMAFHAFGPFFFS